MSTTGSWIQRVAQDWLVWQLTHSVAAVGWATALQFALTPLSLWGGTLADRIDKKRLLIATESLMALGALGQAVLVLTHTVTVPMVYAFCLVMGGLLAFDLPVRTVLIGDLVRPGQLTTAISLNSFGFNIARLTGPPLAVWLIEAVDIGSAFVANGISFAVLAAVLLRIRTAGKDRARAASQGIIRHRDEQRLSVALRYVWQRVDLRAALLVVFVASGVSYNFTLLLTALTTTGLGGGVASYGTLYAVEAVGGLFGAGVAAVLPRRRSLRAVLGITLSFGAMTAISGSLPTMATTAVAMAAAGVVGTLFTVLSQAYVQELVNEEKPSMRGRVMGVFGLVSGLISPIAAALLGQIGERWGGRVSLLAAGAAVVIDVLVVAMLVTRWRRTVPRDASRRRPAPSDRAK